jgi:predicted transcriptional regulator
MKVTRDDVEWIKRLRGHGFSQTEIGKMLGHSQQVIGYQLAKLRAKLLKKYPFLNPEED